MCTREMECCKLLQNEENENSNGKYSSWHISSFGILVEEAIEAEFYLFIVSKATTQIGKPIRCQMKMAFSTISMP